MGVEAGPLSRQTIFHLFTSQIALTEARVRARQRPVAPCPRLVWQGSDDLDQLLLLSHVQKQGAGKACLMQFSKWIYRWENSMTLLVGTCLNSPPFLVLLLLREASFVSFTHSGTTEGTVCTRELSWLLLGDV